VSNQNNSELYLNSYHGDDMFTFLFSVFKRHKTPCGQLELHDNVPSTANYIISLL